MDHGLILGNDVSNFLPMLELQLNQQSYGSMQLIMVDL